MTAPTERASAAGLVQQPDTGASRGLRVAKAAQRWVWVGRHGLLDAKQRRVAASGGVFTDGRTCWLSRWEAPIIGEERREAAAVTDCSRRRRLVSPARAAGEAGKVRCWEIQDGSNRQENEIL